ncbi:MAG: hypothetical protein WAW92_00140 [Minisyncoccia bacterium]
MDLKKQDWGPTAGLFVISAVILGSVLLWVRYFVVIPVFVGVR